MLDQELVAMLSQIAVDVAYLRHREEAREVREAVAARMRQELAWHSPVGIQARAALENVLREQEKEHPDPNPTADHTPVGEEKEASV